MCTGRAALQHGRAVRADRACGVAARPRCTCGQGVRRCSAAALHVRTGRAALQRGRAARADGACGVAARPRCTCGQHVRRCSTAALYVRTGCAALQRGRAARAGRACDAVPRRVRAAVPVNGYVVIRRSARPRPDSRTPPGLSVTSAVTRGCWIGSSCGAPSRWRMKATPSPLHTASAPSYSTLCNAVPNPPRTTFACGVCFRASEINFAALPSL